MATSINLKFLLTEKASLKFLSRSPLYTLSLAHSVNQAARPAKDSNKQDTRGQRRRSGMFLTEKHQRTLIWASQGLKRGLHKVKAKLLMMRFRFEIFLLTNDRKGGRFDRAPVLGRAQGCG